LEEDRAYHSRCERIARAHAHRVDLHAPVGNSDA
jgi:hypothetical protein